jgi:putative ABC transport system ATP-binding protein
MSTSDGSAAAAAAAEAAAEETERESPSPRAAAADDGAAPVRPLSPSAGGLPTAAAAAKVLGEPIVELFGVSKSYKLQGGEEVLALRDVTLSGDSEFPPVRRGEFVMIRGPSGGGKTTLLNIAGLIDTPTKGSLKLFDRHVDFATARDADLAQLRLENVGFVFQAFNLLSVLSAYENVALPMSILGRLPPKAQRARAAHLLTLVGLEDRMGHLPSELSGGEQQRTAIARALANEPAVLLLDEPTGDLDVLNTVRVMDLLLALNTQRAVTMVMVSHDANLECYADRILYVADGSIVGQAVNVAQTRLEADAYLRYLNSEDDDAQ